VAVGAYGIPVNVGDAIFDFKSNPGTVGDVAVPDKSPANCIFPVTNVVASATDGRVTELPVPEMVKVEPTRPNVCASAKTTASGTHAVPLYFKTCPVVGNIELKATPCNLATRGAAAVPPKSPAN
jgi:hypothetical protein